MWCRSTDSTSSVRPASAPGRLHREPVSFSRCSTVRDLSVSWEAVVYYLFHLREAKAEKQETVKLTDGEKIFGVS